MFNPLPFIPLVYYYRSGTNYKIKKINLGDNFLDKHQQLFYKEWYE